MLQCEICYNVPQRCRILQSFRVNTNKLQLTPLEQSTQTIFHIFFSMRAVVNIMFVTMAKSHFKTKVRDKLQPCKSFSFANDNDSATKACWSKRTERVNGEKVYIKSFNNKGSFVLV